jgi:hypothetical protein
MRSYRRFAIALGTIVAAGGAWAAPASAQDSPVELRGKAFARFVEFEQNEGARPTASSVLRMAGDCEAQLGETLSLTFSDIETIATEEDGGADVTLDAPLQKLAGRFRLYIGTATATVTEPDGTTHEVELRVAAHARGRGDRARVFGRFWQVVPRPQPGEPRPVIDDLFHGHFRTRAAVNDGSTPPPPPPAE